MPYSNPLNIHNVKLYMLAGLYPGYSGYNSSDTIYMDDVRRETSLSAAEGGTVASSPPPPSPDGTTALSVTTNLVDGQHFAATVASTPWTATPSGSVASVEFWIDGVRRWVENATPYYYNGDGGALALTTLSNGSHTLLVKAIAADGRTASKSITITRDPPVSSATALSVTTNLVDGQHFAATVASTPWTATPSGSVASVEFWIDGVRRWVENATPYYYNGDGGALALTTLSNGSHTLLVKAIAADGRTASKSITITVD
jgi:hypothetical protein